MRIGILAVAALGSLGWQAAANADEVARYQGAIRIQHLSVPQRAQALAQAERTQRPTNYGRGFAQADTPNVAQARRYAAGERPGAPIGRLA